MHVLLPVVLATKPTRPNTVHALSVQPQERHVEARVMPTPVEYVPAEQDTQMDRPDPVEYVPAAQFVQAIPAEAALIVPGAHRLQNDAPAAENAPAAHVRQVLDPCVEYLPAVHVLHVVREDAALNVPFGQIVQPGAAFEPKYPAVHATHVVGGTVGVVRTGHSEHEALPALEICRLGQGVQSPYILSPTSCWKNVPAGQVAH